MSFRSPNIFVILLYAICSCAANQVYAQFPFDPDTVQFEQINDEPLGDGVRNLLSDDFGRMWITNHNGIFAYEGNKFERLSIDIVNSEVELSPIGGRMFLGPNSKLWFVLYHTGALILDLSNGQQQFFSPAAIQGHEHYDHIWNFEDIGLEDSIALFTDRGFAFINPNTLDISPFQIPFATQDEWETFSKWSSPFPSAVRGIVKHPDQENQYIILSHIPYKYDIAKEKKERFGIHLYEFEQSINIDPAKIFIHKEDVWLTGRLIGFRQVGLHNGQITDYLFDTLKLGPNPNSITSIVQINDSLLFFAAGYHAGAFNINSKEFELFMLPQRDTTRTYPYNVEIAVDGGGHLWWASVFNIYRSTKPIINPKKEPAFYLRIDNIDRIKSPQFKNYKEDEIINISRRGNFTFSYNLINPGQEDEIVYEHKLVGVDADWVPSQATNKNRYATLKPGQYKLELKAIQPAKQIERIITYRVNVEMLWYDHWYSKLFIALGIIGLTWYLFSSRVQKARIEERLKLEYESKLTQLEMNALRAQMNPHFVFNSMNSIKSYLVKKGPDEAADYLTRFGHLIRIILENSKHDILTLEQELKAIQLYVEMENKRFKDPFEFEFEIDPDIDVLYTQIPPMLIQPYVENAIWHGLMPKASNRKLTLQFLKINDGLLCVVEDNGVGRNDINKQVDPLQSKASLGHQITQDRIQTINKIHNCDIRVEIEDLKQDDGSPLGTRVKLYIIGLRI